MKCARCAARYSPEAEYYVLCSQCYEEVGLLGDPESAKMWRGVSLLINTKFSMSDLKELADSVAFCKFAKEVLQEKDIDTRILYLKTLIKDAQS